MVIGLWHKGSGLGDQLFCYLAARIAAQRLGVSFGMVGDFKGKDFITLDKGIQTKVFSHVEEPAGKIIIDNDWPIYEGKAWYDPEFNFIEDNTIVDGCRCQDSRYFEDYPIDTWLQTEPLEMPDELCIIGFRGGEFSAIPELFLTKDYFVDAMNLIRQENPQVQFRVVTDDPGLARVCFPHLEVTHDISRDWRQVRHAKYCIIANSAFYILPALMNKNAKKIIAPRRWARRNVQGEWSTPQSYYKKFTYI